MMLEQINIYTSMLYKSMPLTNLLKSHYLD